VVHTKTVWSQGCPTVNSRFIDHTERDIASGTKDCNATGKNGLGTNRSLGFQLVLNVFLRGRLAACPCFLRGLFPIEPAHIIR
jgi:hypothetical protein